MVADALAAGFALFQQFCRPDQEAPFPEKFTPSDNSPPAASTAAHLIAMQCLMKIAFRRAAMGITATRPRDPAISAQKIVRRHFPASTAKSRQFSGSESAAF
jgi:hypothetical protein